MSGDLDVRDLSVRNLSLQDLNVREPTFNRSTSSKCPTIYQIPPIQLPRVIEGGVWINDSREFGFHISAALATVGGGVHSRVKWCEPHFALV